MQLFSLQLYASCLVLSFFAFCFVWERFCLQLEVVFAYSWGLLTYNWSPFAYNWKVRLISTSTDRKQRSSTVSKEAPTVSRKLPLILAYFGRTPRYRT